MAGEASFTNRVLSLSGTRARTFLRRVSPILLLLFAIVATSLVLPSLPASNPNVAHGGGSASAGGTTASNGASTTGESPSPGSSLSPTAGPAGAFGPGTRPLKAQVTSTYNPYLASAGVQCNTYQGVYCDHIDIVYHYAPQRACPQSQDLSPFLAALGADSAPGTVVPMLAKYFNEHASDFFPNGKQFLGNTPGFYGRKINVIAETDGGTFCDTVTQQTATKIASPKSQGGDEAFGALGGCITCNNEGAPRAMQPALAQFHLISDENTQFLNSWYTPLAPYAWSPLSTGDQVVSNLSDLVCNYLKDRPGTSPNPSSFKPSASQHRVFTTAHVDQDQENQMAATLDQNIWNCIPGGNTPTHGDYWGTDFKYAADPATAGSQAATYSTTVQSVSSTTIVSLADPVASQVGLGADAANNYKHESIVSGFIFLSADQSGEASAASEKPYIIATDEGDDWIQSTQRWEDTWYGKMWIQAHNGGYHSNDASGDNHPPTDLRLWAIDMELLAQQLMVAGPNLTPESIKHGMDTYCSPCVREQGPLTPLPGFGKNYPNGPYNGQKDYSLLIFDPSHFSEWVSISAQTAKTYTPGNGGFMPLSDYSTVPCAPAQGGGCSAGTGPGAVEPGGQFKDLGNLGWRRFLSWMHPS